MVFQIASQEQHALSELLLEKDKSYSVHRINIERLVIKVFKANDILSHQIKNEVSSQKVRANYRVRA